MKRKITLTFQRRKSHSTVIKNKTMDYLNETWIKVKGFVGQPNRDKDSLTISGLKQCIRCCPAESIHLTTLKNWQDWRNSNQNNGPHFFFLQLNKKKQFHWKENRTLKIVWEKKLQVLYHLRSNYLQSCPHHTTFLIYFLFLSFWL